MNSPQEQEMVQCPACKGEGAVEKNFHVGEEGMQIEVDAPVVCYVCEGKKVIPIEDLKYYS